MIISPILTRHQEGSAIMLINNVHLTAGVTQQQVHDVLALVGDSLEQTILPVLALVVDVDPGVLDQLGHGGDVAVPDGEGEGGGAVVRGEVDINIRSLEQSLDNV